MRALQLVLRQSWNFQDEEALVGWNPQCQSDLLWWADRSRLELGCPLKVVLPDLMFWSDASDEGWGAHLLGEAVSGLWSLEEKALSINLRELRAVKLGLLHFQSSLLDRSVAVFSDNTTAVAYLRKQGGTVSSLLNQEAQEILRWAEDLRINLMPQFILGKNNVLADSLSRQNQIIGSEWTLAQEVVDRLLRIWPATIDLFATAINFRLPTYFAPLSDPSSAGTDALLQGWDNLQAYAFPPIAIIRRVLLKLRSSRNCELTLVAPFWPQREWFPDILELLSDIPIELPRRRDLLRQPHFHHFHQNLPMLRLTAWRLSSASPARPASLLRWLDNLPSVGESPPV